MNGLYSSHLAIDTNVFVHMFNPRENVGDHIDGLLAGLMDDEVSLCLDDKQKIMGEYVKHIIPLLDTVPETGARLQVLRYWMSPSTWKRDIEIDLQGPIMKPLLAVLPGHRQTKDRVFVTVACCHDCFLVTNDKSDIANNREAIRRRIARWRTANMDILLSKEAHASL